MSENQIATSSGLVREDAPSLDSLWSLPEEGVGAWPRGWYRADIVVGYTTGKGKVFETKDATAQDGIKRNLFVCLSVNGDVYVPTSNDPAQRTLTKGPGGTRNLRETLNYHPASFDPQTIGRIDAAYKELIGRPGGGASAQNIAKAAGVQISTVLSLGRIRQFQKALGFYIPFNGRYDASVIVDQKVDVRLGIDDKGFNSAEAFARAGSKVK